MPSAQHLELLFDGVTVGTITNAFESDGVWYGTVHVHSSGATQEQQRASEYIAFCKAWNEKQREDDGPDASAFDRFADLMTAGRWSVRAPDGAPMKLDQAPNFFVGDEVSWRLAERH